MKKRQPYILSEEFLRGVDEAVAEAVAHSDALGLPKAYLENYGQLLHADKPVMPAASSGLNKGETT